MGKDKDNGLVSLFLYGGAKDERTRAIYDRVGYYTAMFLFIALCLDIFVKVSFFNVGVTGILSELVILVIGAILLLCLYVHFGISMFENARQKKRYRVSLIIFSIVFASILGYLGFFFELPVFKKLLELGPIAWLVPPVAGALAAILGWVIYSFVANLAARKSITAGKE